MTISTSRSQAFLTALREELDAVNEATEFLSDAERQRLPPNTRALVESAREREPNQAIRIERVVNVADNALQRSPGYAWARTVTLDAVTELVPDDEEDEETKGFKRDLVKLFLDRLLIGLLLIAAGVIASSLIERNKVANEAARVFGEKGGEKIVALWDSLGLFAEFVDERLREASSEDQLGPEEFDRLSPARGSLRAFSDDRYLRFFERGEVVGDFQFRYVESRIRLAQARLWLSNEHHDIVLSFLESGLAVSTSTAGDSVERFRASYAALQGLRGQILNTEGMTTN